MNEWRAEERRRRRRRAKAKRGGFCVGGE